MRVKKLMYHACFSGKDEITGQVLLMLLKNKCLCVKIQWKLTRKWLISVTDRNRFCNFC